jgi:hypothetical protein
VPRITAPTSSQAHHDPHGAPDAEEWTRLFEDSQGRVPLNVAHLQGRDAYGCDCLSFESDLDLDIFRADPKRTDLVIRFIETKSGAAHLTDPEVRAAERRGPRYFIYRVEFYAGSREFAELTIVRDPLKHREALVTECELRVDNVADRERYLLPRYQRKQKTSVQRRSRLRLESFARYLDCGNLMPGPAFWR